MLVKVAKNIRKYESYKYGFERIKLAIEEEFFLEAIIYAESIISDRLLNHLVYRQTMSENVEKLPSIKTSLAELIKQWKKIDGQVPWKEREDLTEDIDKWRCQRNECAHSLAKSNPGNPTKPVKEFINLARESAVEGKILAQYICAWTQQQKRKRKIQKDNMIV
ncbi:hypothetical protein [Calothrix sp. UHCC 0171]|uniref:hypothetical protein n=1 Tax=Calothrix sp. UHCC 0171 TaxID=3110245 RepID=UPI002B201CD4|nr:hypothetical protein [Calothrix sp. UHCC 0171]MEA5571315.1 hypothetical protein [Calothrix sp. UHCC 0171]